MTSHRASCQRLRLAARCKRARTATGGLADPLPVTEGSACLWCAYAAVSQRCPVRAPMPLQQLRNAGACDGITQACAWEAGIQRGSRFGLRCMGLGQHLLLELHGLALHLILPRRSTPQCDTRRNVCAWSASGPAPSPAGATFAPRPHALRRRWQCVRCRRRTRSCGRQQCLPVGRSQPYDVPHRKLISACGRVSHCIRTADDGSR